jgi:hypothetical protein
MHVKILEIRDSATFIAVIAIDMNPDRDTIELKSVKPTDRVRERAFRYLTQGYYLRREGYPCDGKPNIAISPLGANGRPFTNDPLFWQPEKIGRTMRIAHDYIIDHWADLSDGDVVDVEFILGETSEPKVAERLLHA